MEFLILMITWSAPCKLRLQALASNWKWRVPALLKQKEKSWLSIVWITSTIMKFTKLLPATIFQTQSIAPLSLRIPMPKRWERHAGSTPMPVVVSIVCRKITFGDQIPVELWSAQADPCKRIPCPLQINKTHSNYLETFKSKLFFSALFLIRRHPRPPGGVYFRRPKQEKWCSLAGRWFPLSQLPFFLSGGFSLCSWYENASIALSHRPIWYIVIRKRCSAAPKNGYPW